MALDKVIDSAVLDADLLAVADAIRAKGGTSEQLAFPEGFVSAVEAILASGGNTNAFSGEMVIDTETSVPKEGMTFDFGLPSRVKWFFMWHNRESFAAIETPSNSHIGTIIMIPVAVSDIIPIRQTATTAVPDTADRFFLIGNVYIATASDNGYGLHSLGVTVNQNTSVWRANEDGTITIGRPGTAGTYFYPGVFHWIAVC